MNLSINYPQSFARTNYLQSVNFYGRNTKAVFNRSAEEIENIISSVRNKTKKETDFDVTEELYDIVGKCFGEDSRVKPARRRLFPVSESLADRLYEILGSNKSNDLWLAIHEDPNKAVEVISDILLAKESRGKTCDEIADRIIAGLKSHDEPAVSASEAIRSAVEPQIRYRGWYSADGAGLKTALDTEKMPEAKKELLDAVKADLKDNRYISLLTTDHGYFINPSSNTNMFLYVGREDLEKFNDILLTFTRLCGHDTVFELSILGSDKKAFIEVPGHELTQEMKIIDTSGERGILPFLADIAKYLDRNMELVKDIERNAGEIDLSKVNPSIMQKIKDCK